MSNIFKQTTSDNNSKKGNACKNCGEANTASGKNKSSVSKSSNSNKGSKSSKTGKNNTDKSGSNSSDSKNKKTNSFKKYVVKSGDTLTKICQRFYGDGGMWPHILKYQMKSIAANPNLIFPGQIIVLPNFGGSFSNNSGSSSSIGTGNYKPAPKGDESWQTTFRPEYLISDHALTDSKSMTVEEIQKFLEKKGSVLAKPYRGSTPAKMIYNAAQKYGISPKVLLTRLQCEQSLISKKHASQRTLDWALGVGCYDSGKRNTRYKGLDKQIEFAAHTYRRHYDRAQKLLKAGQSITMTIDGKRIKVKNAATYAFYKYCPHVAGNKLFFKVWNGYKNSFK